MRRFLLALLALPLLAVVRGVPTATARPTMPISYAVGWNLIAAPPGTALSAAQAPLFTLQPGDANYEGIDPATGTTVAGAGYWAYFPRAVTVTPAAGSADTYRVTVPPGQYILIGDPSGTLPSTVSGSDDTLTYDPANGYQHTTTLQPGQGAWAFALTGGVVTVTPQQSSTASPTAVATPGMAGLTFLQSFSPGSVPPGLTTSVPSDRWYYTFRVGGPPITGAIGDAQGHGVTLQPAVPFGWGRTSDSNVIFVGLPPGTASGAYTVSVALPNGQTVSATFAHKP